MAAVRYPTRMIEEYRKAVRGLYNAVHGEDSLRNPTAEEWATFTASCSLRDMGTHLCALPTGEYCPKGLVCLGCTHAQPKQSAAPVFRRMLASPRITLRQLSSARTSRNGVFCSGYSYRSACVGAIRDARRAGTYAASIVTSTIDGTTMR